MSLGPKENGLLGRGRFYIGGIPTRNTEIES